MTDTFIQVRTNTEDKERAGEVLESLGTNFSAVVNMLLKQIIATNSIPFDVSKNEREESLTPAEVRAFIKAVKSMGLMGSVKESTGITGVKKTPKQSSTKKAGR